MSKICNSCGKTIDDNANVCPYCRGTTFRKANEVTVPSGDMVHRIFYWPYSQGNVLSKTKMASLAVFLFFLIVWIVDGAHPIAIGIAAFFGAVTYLIGLVIHKFKPQPLKAKIQHNDYGLAEDLKHLLFFWQDKNGNYVLSKTKIFSFLTFVIMFIAGLFTFKTLPIFSSIIFGLIFEIPVFIVGCLIHKLTFEHGPEREIPAKPKKEIKKEPEPEEVKGVIPQYVNYAVQLDELDSKFKSKDASTRELIAKRFEPPQLTYTRFITGVDKSKALFDKNMESARTMINLADSYSPRIAGEVETKINIMKSIIAKLDDLSNELILNEDLSNTGDVDNLIDDMDSLIKSVKDYEN